MDNFWAKREYNRLKGSIAVSITGIYTGLICFSTVLHNHPIGINERTFSSFAVSNQGKDNREISNVSPVIKNISNRVKVISQHQSISCLACAFENNNKASELQAFSQAWSDYSSTACLSFQSIFPQSALLKSFHVRAPPQPSLNILFYIILSK
jgi:hypothetical protein